MRGDDVLVTGASGLVGSHLTERLVRAGHRVTCLLRHSSSTMWLPAEGVNVVRETMPGPVDRLARVISGHRVVFHVAGAVKAHDLAGFMRANADLTEDLVRACLRAEARPERVVIVSSVGAVGPPRPGTRLDETARPAPVTDYGRSKLEAERRALAFADRIDVVILRPGAIYGPRDRAALPLFRAAAMGLFPALGGPGQVLDLVHVADVVQALELAGQVDVASGEVFVVGAGREVTAREFASILGQVVGRRVRAAPVPRPLLHGAAAAAGLWARLTRRPGVLTTQKIPELVARWSLDISKARRVLGYEPRIGLREGLADTMTWYRSVGWI